MLLVGAVDIALGWAWHTAYRARLHWSLKREGALAAAALVALVGAIETIRTHGDAVPTATGTAGPAHALTAAATPATPEAAPALTADATAPVSSEPQPMEILPVTEPVQTVAAIPSPEPVDAPDPIGAKIMERLGDDTATGSVDVTQEAAALAPARPAKLKPAKAVPPKAKRKPD